MKEGGTTRRNFLKTSSILTLGAMARVGDISHLVPKKEKSSEKILSREELRTIEMQIFPKIQEELRKPIWTDYSTIAGNICYLTNDQWTKTAKIPEFDATRERIRNIFYAEMERIAIPRAKALGISPDIYIMMAAKESNFGTSFLAQVASNPFSINKEGKQVILKKYMGKLIKWRDVQNEWWFFDFGNLSTAFDAFDELFKYWKGKSEFNRSIYKDPEGILLDKYAIKIIVKNWNSGANGSEDKYSDFLTRVKERDY